MKRQPSKQLLSKLNLVRKKRRNLTLLLLKKESKNKSRRLINLRGLLLRKPRKLKLEVHGRPRSSVSTWFTSKESR